LWGQHREFTKVNSELFARIRIVEYDIKKRMNNIIFLEYLSKNNGVLIKSKKNKNLKK